MLRTASALGDNGRYEEDEGSDECLLLKIDVRNDQLKLDREFEKVWDKNLLEESQN